MQQIKRIFTFYDRRPIFACGQTITLYPRIKIERLFLSGVLRSRPRSALS